MPRQAALLQGYLHKTALGRGGRICQILLTVSWRMTTDMNCLLTYRAVHEEKKDVIPFELGLLGGSPVRCMVSIVNHMLLNQDFKLWVRIVVAHDVRLALSDRRRGGASRSTGMRRMSISEQPCVVLYDAWPSISAIRQSRIRRTAEECQCRQRQGCVHSAAPMLRPLRQGVDRQPITAHHKRE